MKSLQRAFKGVLKCVYDNLLKHLTEMIFNGDLSLFRGGSVRAYLNLICL